MPVTITIDETRKISAATGDATAPGIWGVVFRLDGSESIGTAIGITVRSARTAPDAARAPVEVDTWLRLRAVVRGELFTRPRFVRPGICTRLHDGLPEALPARTMPPRCSR